MLRIERLNFAYGDLKVLWDVDLEVNEGEIATVVGANGAGKSTTLKNISRLEKILNPIRNSKRFPQPLDNFFSSNFLHSHNS